MPDEELSVVVVEDAAKYIFPSEAAIEQWSLLGIDTYTQVVPATEEEIAEATAATDAAIRRQ